MSMRRSGDRKRSLPDSHELGPYFGVQIKVGCSKKLFREMPSSMLLPVAGQRGKGIVGKRIEFFGNAAQVKIRTEGET